MNGQNYVPKRNGNDHMSICPYGVYSCKSFKLIKDQEYFMLGCATEI